MDANKSKAILEAAGVIAIVVSLGFLAMEIRQSNQIAISTVQYELAGQQNDWLSKIVQDEELARFLAGLREKDADDLDPTDRFRISALVMQYLNVLGAVQTAYENGQISEEIFQAYVASHRSIIDGNPHLAPYYKSHLERLGPLGEMEIFRLILSDSD